MMNNMTQAYNGLISKINVAQSQARLCNCLGPRNGDPVCPCAMPEYRRRKRADAALDLLTAIGKPRVRVKAGRRVVP